MIRKLFTSIKEAIEVSRFQLSGMLLLAVFIIVWILIRSHFFFKPTEVAIDSKVLDSLVLVLDVQYPKIEWESEKNRYTQYSNKKYGNNSYPKITGFFDPNTFSKDELIAVGLTERAAQNIVNFRGKSRKYHKREDLLQLYAISESYYDHIAPYIQISLQEKTNQYGDSKKADNKVVQTLDLNEVTMEALIEIRGIGAATAKKLINYRDKLGGFSSINQVEEIYGLWDNAKPIIYENLIVNPEKIQKRNLRNMEVAELAQHPYLTWNEAKAIISFLKQHPEIRKIEALNQIHILDSEKINKILPYFVLLD